MAVKRALARWRAGVQFYIINYMHIQSKLSKAAVYATAWTTAVARQRVKRCSVPLRICILRYNNALRIRMMSVKSDNELNLLWWRTSVHTV